MIYRGSCHCGAVKFTVEAADQLDLDLCNCSICSQSGFLHLIVPRSDFKLLAGEKVLQTYRFNTGVARHTFCSVCGIKPFYIPRSNPDGVDVNARCLDITLEHHHISAFDGQNWEANAASLAHKSKK